MRATSLPAPPLPFIQMPARSRWRWESAPLCTSGNSRGVFNLFIFFNFSSSLVRLSSSALWGGRGGQRPRVSEPASESQAAALLPFPSPTAVKRQHPPVQKSPILAMGAESSRPSLPHISAGPGRGPLTLITQPRGSMLMMPIITAAVGERNGRSILKGSHGNPLRPHYCKSPGLLEQWLTEPADAAAEPRGLISVSAPEKFNY